MLTEPKANAERGPQVGPQVHGGGPGMLPGDWGRGGQNFMVHYAV